MYHDRDLYDNQHIIDTLELSLRRAGIKINKNSNHTIHISARPHLKNEEVVDGKFNGKLEKHEMEITCRRSMEFKYNGKTYHYYGICGLVFPFNDYKFSKTVTLDQLTNDNVLKLYIDMTVSSIVRANKLKEKE